MQKIYTQLYHEYGYTDNVMKPIFGIPHYRCYLYESDGSVVTYWLEKRDFVKVRDIDFENKVMV